MAWRSTGATNEALVENLFRNGMIKTQRVKQAMLSVDRAHYAPSSPYNDSPQSLGHRATISAPHMHANAAESLIPYLQPGARVLDIGSGSGYLTHVLATLVQPGGQVVGVEHIGALVGMAESNGGKSQEGRELLRAGGMKYVQSDGRLGHPAGAPYDAIHVGAAADGHQDALAAQLKSPGRMFIPVQEPDGRQYIFVVDKDEKGEVSRRKEYRVQYVPLTDAPAG